MAKWTRATCIERNDSIATSGVPDTAAGKVELLDHLKISVSGFRNYHPGLVVLGYGDTHVSKVNEDMDPRVLVALTPFAGREATEP